MVTSGRMRVWGHWRGGAVAAVAIVWVLVAGSRAIAGDHAAPVAAQAPLSDASTAIFAKVCSDCHALDRITATRRDRQQWEEVIDQMVGEGAKATDDEWEIVTKYLLAHFGRVNVNRAASKGLVEVLAISEADAGRIVAYRTTNGKFENFDALIKVPEIDVATLKEHRNEITF